MAIISRRPRRQGGGHFQNSIAGKLPPARRRRKTSRQRRTGSIGYIVVERPEGTPETFEGLLFGGQWVASDE
jgi:hypothetical protein